MTEDFYKILGVRWNATDEQIGKAYRTLVRLYHPDVNNEPEAFEKFQEIQKAFEVLSDPAKRAAFNQTRSKSVPSPAKRVYNPKRFSHPNTSLGFSDKYKLLLINAGAFLLMVLVSLLVFIAVLAYNDAAPPAPRTEIHSNEPVFCDPVYNSAKKKWEKNLKDTQIIVLEFVIAPSLVFIFSINLCYAITHRSHRY